MNSVLPMLAVSDEPQEILIWFGGAFAIAGLAGAWGVMFRWEWMQKNCACFMRWGALGGGFQASRSGSFALMLLYFSIGLVMVARHLCRGTDSAPEQHAILFWFLVMIFVVCAWVRDCCRRDGKYK